MSADSHTPRIRRRGGRLTLAAIIGLFALGAFALNPKGWGLFDTLALCVIAVLGCWQLAKAVIAARG